MTHETDQPLLDAVTPQHDEPLAEAVALGERAALVGFDWEDAQGAYAKLIEEVEELGEQLLDAELEPTPWPEATTQGIAKELGDVLFAACMVARKAGVDPAQALQMTNDKFRRRFSYIERGLAARQIPLSEASLELMEELWQQAKSQDLP